jgi:hypothetical protein
MILVIVCAKQFDGFAIEKNAIRFYVDGAESKAQLFCINDTVAFFNFHH